MNPIVEAFKKIQSQRSKNILKHIGWSAIYKTGSVLIGFLIVPLSLDYLDKESYGIWLTLSSLIGWFSFFDIGMGNGLRNKFAEAKALKKYERAQIYVSNAYFTISAVALGIISITLIFNSLIDWTRLFNTPEVLRQELNVLMPIVIIFFSFELVLKLMTTLYTADQHHSMHGKINLLTKFIVLVLIYVLTKFFKSSLLLFGTLISAVPIVILVALNIIGFRKRFSAYKPLIRFWKKEDLREIMGLGWNFFVIQIAVVVLFSTDNFIISALFGPEEVVPYNLTHKYYNLVTMGYGILLAPFWSTFTEAFAKGDLNWIKNTVRRIERYWLLIPILLSIMYFVSDWFFLMWLGEDLEISTLLSLSMIGYVILMTFQLIHVQFLNGIGKIRLQLIVSILSIFLNIPLSIFLASTLELGSPGVIMATSISLLLSVVLWPLQYRKIINGNVEGIWNE